MSTMLDETSADVPVRDVTVNLSRPAAASQDSSLHHSVRQRQDVSRVSREELEDRYLRLHEENLLLKQHIHEQDDKIRKLGTKLMRLVKDRGRLEQLAVGGAQLGGRLRDVEMEEVMEELQEKVRGLQAENQGLKQRLLVAKQQLINSQSRRPSPYGHVQARVHTRVNTGSKRPRDDPPSPSPSQTRPKSTRSLEGAGRPPTSQLPRYGHSLLEEARAEIRNLENVIESQRSHMEEVEAVSEQLREDLRRKEVEHEEKLLQLRQQHSSKLRSQVNSSVSMVKLQQQLSVRSNAVTELQSRFVQLQQSQVTLKAAHDAAMLKVDELSTQLRDERLKSLELEQQLQTSTISRRKVEQLEEQVKELEQERDLLKENNEKLVNSALDVSQQQRWLIQEQQLRLQVSQLEAALKNDLVDKNQILDKVQAERELSEKLTEENQRLQVQILEQKQQQEELSERLRIYSRQNEYDASELTEALLLVKNRRSQRRGELGFLKEEDEATDVSIRELRAAHAETIQELEKTRNLLNMETRISRDYKAELDVVTQKMSSDKMELELKLQRQTRLLDTKMAKIHKLEAQLSDVAYGTKTYVFRPDVLGEEEDESEESADLERGENLVELQIVGATLTPSILETLGDGEPSTFCTYSFYLFELHSTPVVMGANPRYGFTSRYVVNMDDGFLDYVSRSSVTVELHQALGLDWRTLGTGQLRLQQLLEHDGKIHGSVPLVGSVDGLGAVGSVEFWLRLRVPVTESVHLHRERVKAVDYVSSTQTPIGGSWNQLFITVHSCGDLRSRTSQQPSPYVTYKFMDFSDSTSAIVYDRCDPVFDDLRSYSVLMDKGLDQYLRSEVLQVYVFDNKEEQVDTYLGKAKVPLLPLIQDQMVTGEFELNDPSGLPAGHVQVTLRWEFPYPPSPEEPAELHEEEEEGEKLKNSDPSSLPPSLPPLSLAQVSEAEVSLSQLRLKSQVKDGAAAKRVTFIDSTGAEEQDARGSADRRETTSPHGGQVRSQVSPGSTPQEEEEEESHVSEGQLVPVSSDDSEVSEDLIPDEASAANQDQSESTHSDSDDCIVQGSAAGRKASERVRVEVVSLNLRAESVVACDVSVVRLFVEYNFLDLPTEETPLSLPKPPPGSTINYNYSKVFPVDVQDNRERRSLLRDILQGRRPHMDRIRFTVVSEPPEEEEQERDCEDVGVAFVSITDIMDTQRDLMETNVPVVGVDNSSEVVGTLTVSVEALEALRSIMQDQDQDQDQDPERTLVSSLFPSS